MDNRTVMLLLKVVAPQDTVITEGQMLGVLELSGIVKNKAALKAMEFAAGQVSSTTQATMVSFVNTLNGLVKLNPDSNPDDYAKLEAFISHASNSGADVPLTFGMLLPLLASMPKDPLKPVKPKAAETALRPGARRRARRKAAVPAA